MISQTIQVDIEGRQRGFRFGTYALAVACKESGCATVEQFFGSFIGVDKPESQLNILNLFYGAACQYANHKKEPVDFNSTDVSEWLDLLGSEKVTEMFTEFLKTYTPKNSTPPASPGDTQ